MQPQIHKDLKELLLRGLTDDGYALDWTSMGAASASTQKKKPSTAKIVAKSGGIFFGEKIARAAEAVSREIDLPFTVKALVRDGEPVKKGTKVLEWKGSSTGILVLERPFLNLASYLGGIATRTRSLVDLVDAEWKLKKATADRPRVTSTRKILPHYRDVGIAAVIAGGGFPHRVSLAGGILIKENHVAAAGGIRAAIRGVRKVAPHLLKIEIEVRNLKELNFALAEDAEVIMLDNFAPSEVERAVTLVRNAGLSPIIECSGGITEETIRSYAIPGVHVLSIGGLTHTVTALDLSLLMD